MDTIFEVPEEVGSRFWNLIHIGNDEECWVPKSRLGKPNRYGTFKVTPNFAAGTHRVAYALTFGGFPKRLAIDHLCKNPACCNPSHLEVVTYRENNIRSSRVTKTHCAYGHAYSGDNIYTDPKGSRSCRACRKVAEEKRQRKNRAARRARGLYKRYPKQDGV